MLPDPIDRATLPRATLTPPRRRRISAIWLIPLIAAAVAIGIAVNRIMNEGPTITIVFSSAEGVEAGKTFIKYKDVKIGQVTAVELYQEYSKVMVTARIDKHAAGLMVEDANFWVVAPRVTLSGVSGLGTLLAGNYIGFEQGHANRAGRRFVGLEVPPAVTIDQPGRQFQLKADDMGSLGIGSPLYFRRLQVGQVIAYALADDGKSVSIRVFVNAPYDRFVGTDTRFWNASGVDVSLGAGGLDLRTQSLVSLLIGGIAFESPGFAATSEPAAAGSAFPLYGDRTTAMKQPDTIARSYVLYFSESLRGLSVGAPLTLLGLPAGEVTQVGVDLDPVKLAVRGRVEVVAYPERIVARLQTQQSAAGQAIVQSEQATHAVFKRLVEERGLRAQLRSGSLLTGQLLVALDFFPEAGKPDVDWTQATPAIPTVPSTVPDLEAKVTAILAKIDALPFKAIGADLKKVIESLDKTLKDVNKAVNRIDTGLTPELVSTVTDLRRALDSADRLIKSTDATLLGEDAPGQIQLRDALEEIAGAARAVRGLSDYLERQPASLIRGKTEKTP
ncbi:MlaD family protein [uncultured Lamprocystis sp.]|jgi:paraquat-inducible protein B|uniref:PqiB family protein n=1 Tax=uncultured Lamprocystis sp. TaxID=543132 RepID=UPI0025E1AB95|nr:MlaD family protein [uncultured Lamprocystis sp.]